MTIIDKPLNLTEINDIKNKYGSYIKLTIDLNSELTVAGTQLHVDGETILIEKGGKQDNIWGGGLNLKDKIIDTTAVLNLRPRMQNDSMEILDPQRREKFVNIVKKIFFELWP